MFVGLLSEFSFVTLSKSIVSKFVINQHVCCTENDIRNFVDLANSTLGEDALAAQKTRYLLNALTGYAPLLYDFNLEQQGDIFSDYFRLKNGYSPQWGSATIRDINLYEKLIFGKLNRESSNG